MKRLRIGDNLNESRLKDILKNIYYTLSKPIFDFGQKYINTYEERVDREVKEYINKMLESKTKLNLESKV